MPKKKQKPAHAPKAPVVSPSARRLAQRVAAELTNPTDSELDAARSALSGSTTNN